MLSLIQKNLRPVQICILCAVREELTYICRVCLTKFILYSFSFRDESYPLFQAGKIWHYVLIIGYPLFQAGKIWHYVLIIGYPLFQAGKIWDYVLIISYPVSGREG